MRQIVALSIAFALGTTSPALADDVYEPQVVPACTKYTVPGVGTICGYVNVEDWKAVLEADAELVLRREQAKKEAARADAMDLQVRSLQAQVQTYARTQVVLVKRTEKLTVDLVALDKKYQNERVRPAWGSPVAWTLAAVTTSLLAGMLISDLAD
jgi:hypothetical protein